MEAMLDALPDDGVHVSDSDEVHTSVGDESLPDFTDVEFCLPSRK
jgi:hypothetical protein